MAFYVYLLVCTDQSTYIGATIDLDHRLRQHNKEIKGGARQTGAKVESGKTWSRSCYVSGFPDWTAALQFEWRWKQISRKHKNGGTPLERRMKALETLLSLEKSTTLAVPFEEWATPPYIHFS
jgi:predicted GIY-YIG superfamily endonuclease